jgi:hypothetical protein
MSKSLAVACLALCACGKHASGTAAGTVVLEWTVSSSHREIFREATFSARQATSVTRDFPVFLGAGKQVTLAIHVETSTATYVEEGRTMHVLTPVAISARVVESAGLVLRLGACSGPNYPLDAPGSAISTAVVECKIDADEPQKHGSVWIVIFGDGGIASR